MLRFMQLFPIFSGSQRRVAASRKRFYVNFRLWIGRLLPLHCFPKTAIVASCDEQPA